MTRFAMTRFAMTRFALILAASLVAASPALAQSPAAQVGPVGVSEPWARATATGQANGAAYVTLSTTGTEPDRLTSVSSPAATTAELHTHLMDNGVMRMREVEGGIEVAPGSPTVLKPGGLHIMLMGLKEPLKQGASVPLTLTFEKAGQVTVQAPVLAAGARGPDAHAH